MSARFVETAIPGVVMIEPQVFRDSRGFFLETFQTEKYRAGGIDAAFVQDNHSHSKRGTLRGLHAQNPNAQGKLLRVIQGEVFDVVVEARRGSPVFGRYVTAVLSADNFKQIYVPPGLLHGFVVTSDVAEVEYKCTALYRPDAELSVIWNDPDLAIPWPVDEPILSAKDAAGLRLRDAHHRLIDYRPA